MAVARAGEVAYLRRSTPREGAIMRAEITHDAEQVRQSLALLRRRL